MKSVSRMLERCLGPYLLRRNKLIGRTTERSRLQAFFALLWPVQTQHALIRVGGEGDGGYLVPDDLVGIEACFSPGVSDLATFEQDLALRNIKSFLADHSVDAPPIQSDLIDFEKKYLGPKEDEVFMTLESWVRRKAPSEGDMLLQMDIEGAEYGVIFDTSSATLKRFRILVIEFHGLDALIAKGSFELFDLTFTKLLKDFEVVHIHPNNYYQPLHYNEFSIPPLLEITFLRRDRILSRQPCAAFPHPLDRPCVPDRADVVLPDCWYHI